MLEKDAFAKRFHNVDPDTVPEKNIESVNKLLDDVDGLSGVYKISGKPSIDVTGQNNVSVLAETSQNSDGSTTVKLIMGLLRVIINWLRFYFTSFIILINIFQEL